MSESNWQSARNWQVVNGRILTAAGTIVEAELSIEGDCLGGLGAGGGPTLDAGGALVLPGIVDLHGDAFERQMMPRPGVAFAAELALLDSDRQLAANGITTAYHAVTCSWEPGLRSLDSAARLAAAVAELQPRLACDTRIHLRHEAYNLDGEGPLLDWLATGQVALVAFNDHTPAMLRHLGDPVRLARLAERTGLAADPFGRLLAAVGARRAEIAPSLARIAAAARQAGVPLASHDDPDPDIRAGFRRLGARISEFPLNRETAAAAVAAGDTVAMGAPNVVRGGSHLNLVGAAELVGAGLCTALMSDYYYPALLQAPFRLAGDGILAFARAWDLVSAGPAAAAGLADRGRIAAGLRADLVLVDERAPGLPRVVATVAGGRVVHAEGRLAIGGGFAAAA
ncbi:alpha-D-ribose 1-methylphosphonate 5-triphosphate diphosphatase [Stella sp.]|uniref:alpha-D-ribose 1-methylphosphonate 5-triphosphate diphosphatase n=1 Tax=Stella sp. TaxID=2912054 RepID=UPI0035B1274C